MIEQSKNKAKLIGLDTMDFWINNSPESVIELLQKLDVIVINENEAKLITNENSLSNCIKKIQGFGANRMVIKLGNYGLVYASNTTRFFLPAVLVEQVKDPTGAGDSFAGGFMGYLSTVENLSEKEFKDACVYGSVMASFCVEEFGLDRLLALNNDEIKKRKNLLVNQIKY